MPQFKKGFNSIEEFINLEGPANPATAPSATHSLLVANADNSSPKESCSRRSWPFSRNPPSPHFTVSQCPTPHFYDQSLTIIYPTMHTPPIASLIPDFVLKDYFLGYSR